MNDRHRFRRQQVCLMDLLPLNNLKNIFHICIICTICQFTNFLNINYFKTITTEAVKFMKQCHTLQGVQVERITFFETKILCI